LDAIKAAFEGGLGGVWGEGIRGKTRQLLEEAARRRGGDTSDTLLRPQKVGTMADLNKKWGG